MKKKLALSFCAICVSLTATSALAKDHERGHYRGRDHQEQRGNHNHDNGNKTLKIGLWGDQFYAEDPAQRAAMARQTIASMNARHLDFTLYAGDTKNGSSLCTDQAIGEDVLKRFNALHAPTLYTLGDNEWTDCHRTSNGSYDPLERLAFLRKVFFSDNKSQGRHGIKVQRQGALGQAYSENSRFVRSSVEFVALHVPGSNNNLVATESQCSKKSNRTPADCAAASAEYRARNSQDIDWLKSAFAQARNRHYAGVVILIQADMFFPFELSDGGYQEQFLPQLDENNGYTDVFNTLVEETRNFDGQVLLVHGDSHFFKLDKPMYTPDGRLSPNFTRLEVFGEADNNWIEMTVDPRSENVFSFDPVILQ